MKTEKEIKATIRGITTRNSKLREDIQAVLIDITGHIFNAGSGDVSLAQMLLDGLVGQDRKAVGAWLKEYAAVRLDAKGHCKLNKKAYAESEFDAEFLAAAPKWYTMGDSMEKIAKALDVAAQLDALAKRIYKAKNDDRELTIEEEAIATALRNVQAACAA